MSALDGKIALVTGGSRGIGKAIALKLAGDGADVGIVYRSAKEEAECVAGEIGKLGRRAIAVRADLSVPDEAAAAVEAVLAQFRRLDILVNNAGITRDGLLMRMSDEDWDVVIASNLRSVFGVTRAAVRPMVGQRSGKIVSITSVAGVIGNAGQTNYAASKAGIIGFTKSLARELASRNIQVNAIAPGFVETAMTDRLTVDQKSKLADLIPMKRTAKPEEIAGVASFLASADADYITGQVISVDGGMAM